MKLFFYILESSSEEETFLRIEESEAIEKNGMYLPANSRFPRGSGCYYVHKNHIAHLLTAQHNVVVLTEPNLELAKKLLMEYIDKQIKHHKKMTQLWTNRLNAVEAAELNNKR